MFSLAWGLQAQEPCVKPQAQIDQGVNRLTGGQINNVRARLRTGGDNWWDGSGDGKYVVPAVAPGEVEVSSVFAGTIRMYKKTDPLGAPTHTGTSTP